MGKLDIYTASVGQLQTNCYIITDQLTRETIIVDPGDDADYIERKISDKKSKPVFIIATHGHFDHILAVTELTLAYNIPFLINKKDVFLVENMESSAAHFLAVKVDPPPRIGRFITETDIFKLGDNSIKILETPGHTPGSVCLYIKDLKSIFCGDLLFAGGVVGRTDFSYSNHGNLVASVKKILALPADTVVYPGHGEPTTIGKERQNISVAT